MLAGTTEYYPIATSVMALDPDLVTSYTTTLDILWDMGYDGLSVQYGPIMDLGYYDQAGWDKCKGVIFFFPEWYPSEEMWPEAVAFAEEHEQRFGGEECGTVAFWAFMVLQGLTGVLQEAGTVDDMDKIIATLENETLDTPIGPVKFGLEGLDGIGHMFVMPSWVGEIRGTGEYHRVFYLSTDQAEALALEVFGQ